MMMMMTTVSRRRRRAELSEAVTALLARGLYYSSQWAGELCVGIDDDVDDDNDDVAAADDDDDDDGDEERVESALPPSVSVQLAHAYFGQRQYTRAAAHLRNTNERSPLALFMRIYATFLAIQLRRADGCCEASKLEHKCSCTLAEMRSLSKELAELYSKRNVDGLLLYLYALCLKELGEEEEARSVLVQSVNLFPCNWSAWTLLSTLCTEKNMVLNLDLRPHWMRQFFFANVYLDLHESASALEILEALGSREQFPSSTHVLAQTAMAHYNEREFDIAQDLFEELRERDPHRLENMDTYSNILYVKEARGILSVLAHNAVKVNKFCPETCCIIGNYYSMKSEHEKAVLYFQRALKLNSRYLSAWTLMGHEYVELRNTPSAIESYRKAVSINPHDYRAWYGLGQTYELLQMHTYSLFYFRKAAHLRPYDARMWCAMAESYERLGRTDDAIICYKRAERNNDREGIACTKLAKLYESFGEKASAAEYYRKVLRHQEDDRQESADTVDALMFLAQFYKERAQWDSAEECCTRLLDIGGPSKDHAKSLQWEIYQLQHGTNSVGAATAAGDGASERRILP